MLSPPRATHAVRCALLPMRMPMLVGCCGLMLAMLIG